MSDFSSQASAAFGRATERARAVLRPGDRLFMEGCGGRHTVTFAAWVDHYGIASSTGQCIASKTLDDLAAWNILKVNGQPMSFRDPEGEEAVHHDNARFDRENAHRRAVVIQKKRRTIRLVDSGNNRP